MQSSQEGLLRPGEETVFHLFTVKGIPIKVHPFLPALAVLSALSAIGRGWILVLFVLVLYGPILFGTILIHELGHALETRHLGGHVESIIMWPLGGLALCGGTVDPWQDLKVAIAGPLTHLPMVFAWWLLLVMATAGSHVSFSQSGLNLMDDFFAILCIEACVLNLCLLAFNLFLPAYPLDGGRVMAAALTIKGFDANRAGIITSRTAIVVALGVVGFGIWGFVEGNVHAMLTVLIGLWIIHASKQLHDLATAGRAVEHPLFSRAGTYAVSQQQEHQHQQQGSKGGARKIVAGSLV
jgi:Zn-dependent protease